MTIEHSKTTIIYIIIRIFILIIEFVVGLIFLEFIELNFCGLNENLKRYIVIRALTDSKVAEESKIIELDEYYTIIEDDKYCPNTENTDSE